MTGAELEAIARRGDVAKKLARLRREVLPSTRFRVQQQNGNDIELVQASGSRCGTDIDNRFDAIVHPLLLAALKAGIEQFEKEELP